MKKVFSLMLALLSVLMLCACGAEQAPDSIAITDYNIDGSIEVHSCSYRVQSNGNTEFTLDYTAPAGRSIVVFDPPNGDLFQKVFENATTGKKDVLIFELTAEEIDAIDEVTINFCSENGEYDFVYFWVPKEG